MATPVTYLGKRTGKQFVAIAAGGGNKYDRKFSGKLVVFSLP
jgi:glucose dehydrogenase